MYVNTPVMSMSITTPSIQPIQDWRTRASTWRTCSRRAGGARLTSPSTSGSGRTAM